MSRMHMPRMHEIIYYTTMHACLRVCLMLQLHTQLLKAVYRTRNPNPSYTHALSVCVYLLTRALIEQTAYVSLTPLRLLSRRRCSFTAMHRPFILPCHTQHINMPSLLSNFIVLQDEHTHKHALHVHLYLLRWMSGINAYISIYYSSDACAFS